MNHYFKKISIPKYMILLIIILFVSAAASIWGIPIIMNLGIRVDETVMLTFLTSLVMYTGMILFIWQGSLTREERHLILKVAPARSRRNILFAMAGLLLSLPINFLYAAFLDRFFPQFLDKVLNAGNLPENFLNTSDPLGLILLFLAVVVMAPVVEELMFRGVLYNLLNKYMSLTAAAVLSSLVFGLLHGATFLQTAFVGFIFAFVYQVTGDLKTAMLGHAINNGTAYFQGVLLQQGLLQDGSRSEMIVSILLLGSALAMVILSILYLVRNPVRSIYNDMAPIYKHEIGRQLSAVPSTDRGSATEGSGGANELFQSPETEGSDLKGYMN